MTMFIVHFLGPFHVAQGTAADGADRTIDPSKPLPATSLKGLMRAEAKVRLGLPEPIVHRVFGSTTQPCPWRWSDLTFGSRRLTPRQVTRSARIHVASTGAAQAGYLAIGEDVWLREGTFEITRQYDGGPAADPVDILVLRASARSVTALGGARRRGSGWVSITDDQPWTEGDSERLLAALEGRPR